MNSDGHSNELRRDDLRRFLRSRGISELDADGAEKRRVLIIDDEEGSAECWPTPSAFAGTT